MPPPSLTSRPAWRLFRGGVIFALCLGIQLLLQRWESNRLLHDGSFLTLRSPGGVWWADIRKTDPWIYAPQDMHVVVVPLEYGLFELPRMPFEAFQLEINNDGAVLGESNLSVRWEGDSVLHLTARGEAPVYTEYRVDLTGERAWWRHDRLGFIPGALLTGLVFWLLLEFAWATLRSISTRPPQGSDPDPKDSGEPPS